MEALERLDYDTTEYGGLISFSSSCETSLKPNMRGFSASKDSQNKLGSESRNKVMSFPSNYQIAYSQSLTKNEPMMLQASIYEPYFRYRLRQKKMERDQLVQKLVADIRLLIAQDDFIDGEFSKSEQYILDVAEKEKDKLSIIRDALGLIYEKSHDQPQLLVGVLTIISCLPYEVLAPNAQIMAMGALRHKDIWVKDKAIQCFERWNSKKGLEYIRNFKCEPSWLQRYVDRVVYYIESDGLE